MPKIWVISPYDKKDARGNLFEDVWNYDLGNGVVALGASSLNKVSATNIPELTQDQIEKIMMSVNPDPELKRTAKSKARTIWQFFHETAEGDIFIAKEGMRQILAIGIAVKRDGRVSFYDKKRGLLRTSNIENCYPNFINVKWFRDSDMSFSEEVFQIKRFSELEKGFRRESAKLKCLPMIQKKIKALLAGGDYLPLKGDATVEETFELLEENPESLIAAESAQEFPEGKEKFVQHLSRERSAALIQRAKEKQRQEFGKNLCLVCGFDFEDHYGEVGKGYIEVHHTTPVSELKLGDKTQLCDVALVCSNCHRMIHRKRPWLSLEQLRALMCKRK